GGLVWLVWRLTRRWRRTLWSDLAAAARMQQAFPQLGDRLASAIEFLKQTEEDRTAGSPAMRRAVVAETTATVEGLPLGEVAHSPALRKATIAVAVLAIGLLGLWLVRPEIVGTAIARIAAPWNDVDWPRRHTLEFVDPPAPVARGSAVGGALAANRGRLPEDVVFEYRWESEGRRRSDTQQMQRVGDTMVARRDKVTRSFAYRAVGGDHHSMGWHEVEVVDPPAAESLTTTVHPPEYTG